MNCDRAFASLRARIGAGLSVEDPRGARHWAHLRATDLYAVGSFDPNPRCRHAHRRRSSGRRAHSLGRHQVPGSNTVSRHLGSQFGSPAEKPARAPNGAESYAPPLQDAGRKMTPSNGSPVVTKRQSAMISLRASATIMVLRVPLRLSVVRARYHNASALSF